MKEVIRFNNVNLLKEGNTILENVSFSIFESSITAIIGPNGGGKTSILKLMLGLYEPSSGTIITFDHKPKEAVKKGFFGYVPQKINASNDICMNAEEVVELGAINKKYSKKEFREKLSFYGELLGVMSILKRPFSKLSGGQQQRINILRAIISEPKALLLDEPSTGIDIIGQKEFYKTLMFLKNEKKMNIILVSHDIGVIGDYIDEVICVNKKIFYHGKEIKPDIIEKMYGEFHHVITHEGH